jgi:hypothetical protein
MFDFIHAYLKDVMNGRNVRLVKMVVEAPLGMRMCLFLAETGCGDVDLLRRSVHQQPSRANNSNSSTCLPCLHRFTRLLSFLLCPTGSIVAPS